jgi:membrane protease YdiL (CAAX protease family)
MDPITTLVRRSPLVSFLVLTFALCWGVGAVINGTPVLAPNASFLIGALIAALTIVALSGGRAGLKDLARSAFRWRVSPIWYAVVFVVPVMIVAAVLVLVPVLGGTPPDWTKAPSLAETAMTFALFMVFPFATPIAEEIGWRGVALPRLLVGRSALVASLILGGIWALWHLPVVLSAPTIRVPIPFMLTVIPTSVLFTWIYLHTRRSVFIAILFHATLDAALGYGLVTVSPADAALVWWLVAATETVMVLVVIAVFGPNLERRPSRQADPRAAAVASA